MKYGLEKVSATMRRVKNSYCPFEINLNKKKKNPSLSTSGVPARVSVKEANLLQELGAQQHTARALAPHHANYGRFAFVIKGRGDIRSLISPAALCVGEGKRVVFKKYKSKASEM